MSAVPKPLRDVVLERACSRVSLSCSESLRGTASTVRHWLLVEQPGAWGHNALQDSDLPVDVAATLARRGAALDIRVVLIRRPGRAAKAATRSAYLVHSGPSAAWSRRLTFLDPRELLDMNLQTAIHDRVDATEQPLYLVCTNGKHDLCCAVAGLPLARALAGLGDVWECSHIGGDRFAGNLVCLPHGFYYGRVTPDVGLHILERHARGELLLTHLRGRSSYEFATQAADVFVRQARALHRIDDVALESTSIGGGVLCTFRTRAGESLRVVVDVAPSDGVRRLTCQGAATSPPVYRVRWLDT